MNQSQDNILKLAAAVRGHKKAFAAVCSTAKKLNLPSPKRQPKQPSAATARLQNHIRKIHPADLQNAISKFGVSAVHNEINCASIVSPRSPPPLPESMDEFIGQLQPQAASAWATTPQCGYWAGSANA